MSIQTPALKAYRESLRSCSSSSSSQNKFLCTCFFQPQDKLSWFKRDWPVESISGSSSSPQCILFPSTTPAPPRKWLSARFPLLGRSRLTLCFRDHCPSEEMLRIWGSPKEGWYWQRRRVGGGVAVGGGGGSEGGKGGRGGETPEIQRGESQSRQNVCWCFMGKGLIL